jgi:N-methylhydantoinase A
MLMSDLQHDFVRSFVTLVKNIDQHELIQTVEEMVAEGRGLLAMEDIPEESRQFSLIFDCRYLKQYHEVSVPVSLDDLRSGDLSNLGPAFHAEHNRMYGYSLEDQDTPIELINLRVRALGITEKPTSAPEPYDGEDPESARKGDREVLLPVSGETASVPVYDGHATRHGNRIIGPAIIEQVNTTLFLTTRYDCRCDSHGSFVVYAKGREELVEGIS